MRHTIRFDFIENPSGTGYAGTLNGRRIQDSFADLPEVLGFARALGIRARYAGMDPSRITAEGGRLEEGDEDYVH